MQRFRRAAPAGGDLLSGITSALNSTRKDMQVISAQVVDVAAKNDALSGQLAALMKQFEEFVARDRAHKEISVSETRLVRVNQELETKYGHHAELRRRATGILQATDLNIVREETIRTATEEMMIGAPGYWLAPALVALSAWIADKRELAERALAESLRRDGAKTALLLSL